MIDKQRHVSMLSLASAASAVHRRNTAAPAAATALAPAAAVYFSSFSSAASAAAAAAAAAGTPSGWCALESAAVFLLLSRTRIRPHSGFDRGKRPRGRLKLGKSRSVS